MTEELSASLHLDGLDLRLNAAAATDIGPRRARNEDSYLCWGTVFAVADGMGGHLLGDRASGKAVATLQAMLSGTPVPTPQDAIAAVNQANAEVWAIGAAAEGLAGTTLAGVCLVRDEFAAPHWMVFNVGDSRVYRWANGILERVTVDHSSLQELLDAGTISEGQLHDHPERNVITRALGVDEEVEADVWLLPALGRQWFLICSDGLIRELDDQRLSDMLASAEPAGYTPAQLADTVLAAALAAGTTDNATVVLVEAIGTPAASSEQTLTHLEDTAPRPR